MSIAKWNLKEGCLQKVSAKQGGYAGWVNYFKLADMKGLKEIDEWMRRRIRMVYWKQWKRIGYNQTIGSLGVCPTD